LKESGETWLQVMETAHGLGVESTATFMMGTGETNAERIEHLRMIRDVQDRTGGFRSFIPWTYQPEHNHLKGRTQATSLEYLRLISVARLFFDNINHLQGSWLTTGKDIGQLTLHYGADDLGSIMLEENVVSSAGARHRSNRTEIIELIRGAGRIPAQRDTLYHHLVVHTDPANDPIDARVHSHFSSTALPASPVAAAS
jgi:cyclic dehypoxanthinyl futalosine synthase